MSRRFIWLNGWISSFRIGLRLASLIHRCQCCGEIPKIEFLRGLAWSILRKFVAGPEVTGWSPHEASFQDAMLAVLLRGTSSRAGMSRPLRDEKGEVPAQPLFTNCRNPPRTMSEG